MKNKSRRKIIKRYDGRGISEVPKCIHWFSFLCSSSFFIIMFKNGSSGLMGKVWGMPFPNFCTSCNIRATNFAPKSALFSPRGLPCVIERETKTECPLQCAGPRGALFNAHTTSILPPTWIHTSWVSHMSNTLFSWPLCVTVRTTLHTIKI